MTSVLLALILTGSPAAELQDGRELFRGMHYRAAEEKLSRLREAKDLSVAERRELYDLLARSLGAQGKLAEVEAVYAELLAVDPDAPPPEEAAPKIASAYRRARARVVKAPREPPPPPAPAPAPAAEPEPEPEAAPAPAPAPEPAAEPLPLPLPSTHSALKDVISQNYPPPEPEHPRWVLWSMGGFAGVTALCGLGLLASVPAEASERAFQQQVSADVFLGAAAVAVVGAALLWWTWR